jgi:hypothetical protein
MDHLALSLRLLALPLLLLSSAATGFAQGLGVYVDAEGFVQQPITPASRLYPIPVQPLYLNPNPPRLLVPRSTTCVTTTYGLDCTTY